jgi:hypothetical protein
MYQLAETARDVHESGHPGGEFMSEPIREHDRIVVEREIGIDLLILGTYSKMFGEAKFQTSAVDRIVAARGLG